MVGRGRGLPGAIRELSGRLLPIAQEVSDKQAREVLSRKLNPGIKEGSL
jgi:hypothetical protein